MLGHDTGLQHTAAGVVEKMASVAAPMPPGATLIGTGTTNLHEACAPLPQLINHGEAHFTAFEQYAERVVLQEGRHSVVVSAWHIGTAQPVVIKAYTKTALKPRQLANVYREVKLLVILNHNRCPGVVDMLAAFEDDFKLYLVFKACMRGDLYQLLMKVPTRRLDEHLVASAVTLPLVLTVAELHNKQIIHRDIKPENVFIDLEGHVQLGDFGLAAQHTDSLTERVGTLDYMAPEVLAMPTPSEIAAGRGVPKQPYNEKIDVWAIGCLCYELLCGSPPFEVQDPKETAKLIMVGKPAPFPPGLSNSGTDFIRQALAHKPSQRPSAQQLLSHPWLRQHMRTKRTSSQTQRTPGGDRLLSPVGEDGNLIVHHNHQSSSPYDGWGINNLELLSIHENQQRQSSRHHQHQADSDISPRASTSPKATSPTTPVISPKPFCSPVLHAYATSTSAQSTHPPTLHHAYPTSAAPMGRAHDNHHHNQPAPPSNNTSAATCASLHLPPGQEISETSSSEDATEGAPGGDSGSDKGLKLRPHRDRRASSGTSEYLSYNTPRASSPEMTRSYSANSPLSPFSSLSAVPSGALPVNAGQLRATTSCNGTVECAQQNEKEEQLQQVLTWQSSAPATAGKKSVGKSRFAR